MFEKLVSGLPYSPALVGQLGFYARRLKKEELTRRMGLVFTALALVVQSFAVFSPPESANAANPSNLISGGVTSIEQLISVYDQSANGNGDYKAIMDYNGISRADLLGMREGSVNSRKFGTGTGTIISWGRSSRFSAADGQVQHTIPLKNGGTPSTVYSVPLWRFDGTSYTIKNGSTYPAFIGTTAGGKWFAIQKACGNLMTRETPKPFPAGALVTADCRTIRGYAYDARQRDARVNVYLYLNGPPGSGERIGPLRADQAGISSPIGEGYGFSASVPEKYTKLGKPVPVYGVMVPLAGWNQSTLNIGSATIPGPCYAPPVTPQPPVKPPTVQPVAPSLVVQGKQVRNLTQNIADANGTTAQSGDRLEYTVSIENAGGQKTEVTMEEDLADVLEYASLQNYANGRLGGSGGKVLSWGRVSLAPNQKETRSFVVQINQIPATPQGISDPSSYDCKLNNVFGNTTTVRVECPAAKTVEQTVRELPSTGPRENIIFGVILLMIVTYFYARSRQFGREVRLIRHDFNAGTL